jgi:predicted phosphodiesterase
MKFALCSDLHLEFGPIELLNTEGADVLVLSGDILVAKDVRERYDSNIMDHKGMNVRIHNFFDNFCSEFENVIYVMGNHEHYHGDFAKSYSRLKEHLGHHKNLHIMEKEFIRLGDVTFVAGTLWTDMNKEDPVTLNLIKGYMNDYRIIENSAEVVHYTNKIYGKTEGGFTDYDNLITVEHRTRNSHFSPELSVQEHKATLKFIAEVVDAEPTTKFVVVGHHAPSKVSTKPQYEKDVEVNGAYSSDLSDFILDRPQIKVWTHGHTHHDFDYMVGSTRVVANPRGYHQYEAQADNFELQFIEV